MASALQSLESRDLGEWRQLEDQEPDQDDEERNQSRRQKGKSKDLDFRGFDAEMGVSEPEVAERESMNDARGSYPPMSEEAAEEREIVENLKRWEVAERLRRKAMRESRSLSGGSTTSSPVVNLARRASQVLFRRSTGSNRDSATRVRTDSPTALDDLEQQRSSLTRIETADTERNPFRDAAAAESNPALALMTPTSADPFANKKHERSDSMSTVTGEPAQPIPQRPILQASGSSFLTEEPGAIRIPPPRPLDIPTTPAPQHVYEGGGAVPARMSGPREGMRVRRTAAEAEEDEEEIERERQEGRWWTDWLCGLKEKRDPNGQVSDVFTLKCQQGFLGLALGVSMSFRRHWRF
ncbi:hypothetical protein RhiJN_07416 [Ceratobasidium sp. AG-Ba]|nr:hypothetical protein RhiJN_07416 [Ceratobasidium sp. AG-Ba]